MSASYYVVRPSTLKGEICIPPSKSHTMRALLFAAMGKGKSYIHHPLPSPDTTSMLHACLSLGAEVKIHQNFIEICGVNADIVGAKDIIHVGNSGILLRFLSAVASLGKQSIVLTGDHSIRHQRPMQPLLDGLHQLGAYAKSTYQNGKAPLIIKGPLKGGHATVEGEDSQPVSALLIGASLAEEPSTVTVKNPGEKPFIDLTFSWFDRLGIPYTRKQPYTHYSIPGKARYDGFRYTVPGDLSTLSFPIAAALVTQSELLIHQVDLTDPQGDKELIEVFRHMGARIETNAQNNTLFVHKSPTLHGISVDVNHFIDAVPILAVVACFAEGETSIQNAANARHKECDRLHCITKELQKMGADIHEESSSGLRILGGKKLHGAHLHSYDDHRMAMALAVAALGAKGESRIDSVSCTTKTFPYFAGHFQNMGAYIQEVFA